MSGRQGFYSVVQYVPFPERFEFMNVGVVVLAPAINRVEVRFAPDYSRIAKIFGKFDRAQLKSALDSLARRLQHDFGVGYWSVDALHRFVEMRSGNVQMSSPLSILLDDDPAEISDRLLKEMVIARPKRLRASTATSQFKRHLANARVLDLVDTSPDPIVLPQGVQIRVPYGYQNGSYNLIDPIRLAGPVEEALKNASSRAIEGQWLAEHSAQSKPKRLVVVGDLSDQPERFASDLKDVMRNHEVRFYEMDDMDELIEDIRRHGPITVA